MRPKLIPPCPNGRATTEPIPVRVDGLRMAGLNAGPMRAPLGGSIRALVLLTGFRDRPFTTDNYDYYMSLINVQMSDYFGAQSGDSVRIVGDFAVVQLPNDYAYYAHDHGFGSFPSNAQGMAREALDIVSDKMVRPGDSPTSRPIRLSDYDNDRDGYIDSLIIIHVGHEAAVTGEVDDIWAHQWGFPTWTSPDGSVRCNKYMTGPEWFDDTILPRRGLFCHEAGHLLFDLPDLYQNPYVGRNCLMANGAWGGFFGAKPTGLSAPMLVQAGFVVPRVFKGLPELDQLPPGEVWAVPVAPGDPRKMVMVQRRDKAGIDSEIASPGVQVYMVDNEYRGNGGAVPQVRLIQQSGAQKLDSNYTDDALNVGDVLGTELTLWYDDSYTGVVVERPSDGDVRFGRLPDYDVNADGTVNIDDVWAFVDFAFYNGQLPPGVRPDFNFDDKADTIDLNLLIERVIRT